MSSLLSTLDSVTVYREGATCRRIAKIAAGTDRQLRLGGLPLSLEAGSLRARVQTGGGRVVDVRPQYDVELAEEVFHMPVRLGVPQHVRGLGDVVRNPIYSTGVGLLLYGKSRAVHSTGEPPVGPGLQDVWGRMKSWFQGNF